MLLNYLIGAAVAGVAIYFLVQRAYALKARVDQRRIAAGELAGSLQGHGLVRVPRFLRLYAAGDYSGMANELQTTAQIFKEGEEGIVREFQAIGDRHIEAKLRTPEGRAALQARIDEAKANAPQVS